MTIKGLLKERKRIVLYSMILYITFSFLYLTIAIVLQVNTNEVRKIEITKNEERIVNAQKNIFSNKVEGLMSDLLFIADHLNGYSEDVNVLKEIENKWKMFSDRKRIYDQIRYIDFDGNEKIRINYSKNGAIAVHEEALKNKKDRYYFKDTIGLKKEQIYVSRLDLNVENGKVEKPIKPMIRLSTPVFSKDGKTKGIVILNYYAQNLLRDFENIAGTSIGNVFLLDSNGYWIYNDKNKDKEWSFMYEDKKNVNFKNEFPEEWEIMQRKEKGTISTLHAYYSYVNIIDDREKSQDEMSIANDSIVLGEGSLIAMSFISKDSKNGDLFFINLYQHILHTLKKQKFIFLLILIVSVNFAVLMTINKMSKERTKYFSEYDTMTGVFNRRAGFELLNKTYEEVMKNGQTASLCFIDINGLKEVNDHLGHEAGDELIISVVNGIKKCIRQSDFIIRIGGDEFLIMFVNGNQEQAENIWTRINDEYKQMNETENRKYIISASHGIEEFKVNANEHIDKIINSADEKMYNEKRIIKKDLTVVRKNF